MKDLFKTRDRLIEFTELPTPVGYIYESISIVDQDIKAVLNAMENAASFELYEILIRTTNTTELPAEIRKAEITALKGLIPRRYYAVRDNQSFIYLVDLALNV